MSTINGIRNKLIARVFAVVKRKILYADVLIIGIQVKKVVVLQ